MVRTSVKPKRVLRFDPSVFANEKQGSIFVFDFDGVLCSRIDDDIYKAKSSLEDKKLIRTARKILDVNCEGLSINYQRHLIYQAAAWKLRLPMEPGPATALAKSVGRSFPVFIVTARSGWYAIRRMQDFLTDVGITPVEAFHVGRTSKRLQIEMLAREYKDDILLYFEDSAKHLAGISGLDLPNLKLYQVAQPSRTARADLALQFLSVVTSAILETQPWSSSNS